MYIFIQLKALTVSLAERCDFGCVKLKKVHKLFQVLRICARGVAELYGSIWLGVIDTKNLGKFIKLT